MSFKPCLIFPFLLLLSCNKENTQTQSQTTSQNLHIKGSNTELDLVKKLSEEYTNDTNKINISVEGGGSNEGIKALKEGKVKMINSSRKLAAEDYHFFAEKNIEIKEIIFAVDAIAIIMNPKIGIDSLSIHDLSQIFSGTIKNWSALGGKPYPIHTYGRNNSSGTANYMSNRLFGNTSGFTKQMTVLKNHQDILTSVIQDTLAIGYVDLSTVRTKSGLPHPKVWVPSLHLDGQKAFSPFEMTSIENEDYPLTRPLFQFIKAPLSEAERKFIQFELSEQGQRIVKERGFYPILSIHKHINSKEGI